MYSENYYDGETGYEDLTYDNAGRSSDIPLPPVLNAILFVIWLVLVAAGFGVMFLANSPVAGVIIMGVPTFIGMVMKPSFALCLMMLVLPTGAGIGYHQEFSLDRGIGLALAVSFLFNLVLMRPRLPHGRPLWILLLYTLWLGIALVGAPYVNLEAVRVFTSVQLLALVLIVLWILESNGQKALKWALRAYVLGTLGTIAIASLTGAAIRTMSDTGDERYAATVGEAIDANWLASLIALALLTAIFLFVKDRSRIWRTVYVVGMIVMPLMILKTGSRGGVIALAFTVMSPLLFVRQVLRRPILAALLLAAILTASIGAGMIVKSGRLGENVTSRFTDVSRAKEAVSYRMEPIRAAVKSAMQSPIGTSYYGWFGKTGLRHIPHNDFFLALGMYGIPAATLFAVFIILIMLTVHRIPLGPEKIYTRAVLTYLLIMGLNVPQIFTKHYWTFLTIIIAIERLGRVSSPAAEELPENLEYDDTLLPDYQLV